MSVSNEEELCQQLDRIVVFVGDDLEEPEMACGLSVLTECYRDRFASDKEKALKLVIIRDSLSRPAANYIKRLLTDLLPDLLEFSTEQADTLFRESLRDGYEILHADLVIFLAKVEGDTKKQQIEKLASVCDPSLCFAQISTDPLRIVQMFETQPLRFTLGDKKEDRSAVLKKIIVERLQSQDEASKEELEEKILKEVQTLEKRIQNGLNGIRL